MGEKQNKLSELIKEKEILLADGATGTNYFNMGLEAGEAPELWNEQQSHKVIELHSAFVDAGADIILSNTFGGNRNRLKLHNAENKVYEINKKAVELAKEVAEKKKKEKIVLVAGCVGPTGELFEPLGELTHEDAVEIFKEQMNGLKDGGADIIWIETMSAKEEMNAAAQAAQEMKMEYVITASFDTAGKTMMGIEPENLMEIANGLNPYPKAVGANCGVGATDLLFSIIDMEKGENENNLTIIAKANCGIPQIKGDKVVYGGDEKLMAKYAKLAIDAGAKIIGGCCGTSPAHLAAMRKAIDNHTKGKMPSPQQIVETTGALVNEKTTKKIRQTRRRK